MMKRKKIANPDFKFNTRKEYEKEITKLLLLKSDDGVLRCADDEYESMVEEYLRFCELGSNV